MNLPERVLLILSTIFLSACGGQVGGYLICSGGSSSGVNCEGGATYTRQFLQYGEIEDESQPSTISLEGFDAGNLVVDLGQSTTDLVSNSGSAIINLSLTSGQVVSQSFPWVRQGQQIIPQNPSVINSWLSGYSGNISSLDVSLGNFTVSNPVGANTVVMEAVYSGSVQTGSAQAWYNDGSGGGCFLCQVF